MFNPLSIEHQVELRALIEKHGLQAVEAQILDSARSCWRFRPQSDAPMRPAMTRLGGLPDGPLNGEPPSEELLFLGQINLQDAKSPANSSALPARGLLSFFCRPYSEGANDSGLAHRIYLTTENLSELVPANAPPGFLPVDLTDSDEYILKNVPQQLERALSLPALYTRASIEICRPKDDSAPDLTDEYLALLADVGRSMPAEHHQLLGHHAFMDGDADEQALSAIHGVSAQLRGKAVTPAEKAETLAKLEKRAQEWREQKDGAKMAEFFKKQKQSYLNYLENKAEIDGDLDGWVMLLQIDSDDSLGASFGDAGFIYFLIRKSDLAAARFDRTYARMWAS